jgi:hypothetical protein
MDARGITEDRLTNGARRSTLDELADWTCGPTGCSNLLYATVAARGEGRDRPPGVACQARLVRCRDEIARGQ